MYIHMYLPNFLKQKTDLLLFTNFLTSGLLFRHGFLKLGLSLFKPFITSTYLQHTFVMLPLLDIYLVTLRSFVAVVIVALLVGDTV